MLLRHMLWMRGHIHAKTVRFRQEVHPAFGRIGGNSRGNRSQVVREAIGLYAAMEASLEEIEANPKFIEMMERSAADIRAGRVHSQEEVEKHLAKKRKRR